MHRCEVVTHLVRAITKRAGAARAETTTCTKTKTFEGQRVEHDTGVGHPRHDRAGSAAGAKGDGGQIVAEFVRLIATIILITHAQSTVCTTAPALDRVVVKHHTGVDSPSTQRHCREAGTAVRPAPI